MDQSLSAERILATVLFTDVVGSTKLAAEMGDRDWHELLERHHDVVRRELGRFNGREVKTIGDGFLALFDSPARAVLCAKAIIEGVQPLGLHVRAGVHTGECEVMGDDVGGIGVHIGARVASLAGADEVMVSSTVKDLVAGSHIEFTARGSRVLKGVPGRWRLFSVVFPPADTEPEAGPVRPSTPLVGRTTEMAILAGRLEAAAAGATTVAAVEGEPGIGKTRLLDEAAALAADRGFAVVFVGADEEIGGAFYLARTLLGSPALARVAADPAAKRALKRAQQVVGGKRDATLASLPQDDQLLHVYDAATAALHAIAKKKPLALFLDDLQWSDPDSLRLIRYLIRSDVPEPLFVMLASRPDVPETRTAILGMVVDAERLGVGRRIPLDRFGLAETSELMSRLLEGPVSPNCAEAVHAQSEGVPFIVQELVRSLREAGTVQSIDGTWEMARGSERMVPASVQSLIERRASGLSAAAREVLADAAALGRRFALDDLAELTRLLRQESAPPPAELASILDEAVRSGLISEAPTGSRFDYSFTHDQARSVLAATHGRPRRRLVHGAIVRMLSTAGDIAPDRLADAAHHALLAEDLPAGAKYSALAARAALDAGAPEEAARLCEAALALVQERDDRVELLRLEDDALGRLRRGDDRAAVLDELGRLTSATGSGITEGELLRRRASAARQSGDLNLAEELATIALDAATAAGDEWRALDAALELGQARLQAPLGESFSPPPSEVDLDAAGEAFERARELARRLGDERLVAATTRELGVLDNGRGKRRAMELLSPQVLADGRFVLPPDDAPQWKEIELFQDRAKVHLSEALEIYERLDDRAGVMATVIALGYSHYHAGVRRGVAGVIEQIRKLRQRLRSMTTESERQTDEVHLLYSVHAYARFYHYADLALERGEEAYRAARTLGDRWMEFLAAGGLALTHIELGEVEDAERWLGHARAAAAIEPTPLRARRLELWRGFARAAAEDAAGAIERLERARALGFEHRNKVGPVEATAWLAFHGAALGTADRDESLLDRAEGWANEARGFAEALPGQHPWGVLADSARAQVALARGKAEEAAEIAHAAVQAMDFRFLEPSIFEILLVAARAGQAAGAPWWDDLRVRIREDLDAVAERILVPDVRQRWLAAPMHRELAERAGDVTVEHGAAPRRAPAARELDQMEVAVWRLVARGLTNREISGELGLQEKAVGQTLKNVFAKLGVNSRATATTLALREGIA